MYWVGMMSGTSLDGVDAVLAKYTPQAFLPWQATAFSQVPIPDDLREVLLTLNHPGRADNELHCTKIAEQRITHCYADAYRQLIAQSAVSASEVKAIAAHGQTIRHQPDGDYPYSLQLMNGALLAALTQTTVVCDFRSRDIAAGGQGAPLAPLFHRQLFAAETDTAVVNIGGISNISLLTGAMTTGFDCGPGNCLLDEWIDRHCHQPYDKDADWARQGKVLPDLLDRLLSDNFFLQSPPKSTGRTYFHLDWLRRQLSGDERPVDVMRTLVRLTATAIANCVPKTVVSVVVVGGGAKNPLMLEELDLLLANCDIVTSDAFGVDPQWIEALGFAMLGRKALLRESVDSTSITGATAPIIAGCVYYV